MDEYINKQDAIDIVEFECGEWSGLARTIVEAIEQLPPAQQWIPCGEKLPEPGVNVLVDVLDIPADDRFPLVDKIGDDGDWCNCYGEWLAVAWVPIPDPWEGGNDG